MSAWVSDAQNEGYIADAQIQFRIQAVLYFVRIQALALVKPQVSWLRTWRLNLDRRTAHPLS